MAKLARRQHELPRFYLKGFCQGQPAGSYLWVYTKGKPFDPGLHKEHNNPYRSGPNETARVKDLYAFTRSDGQRDFDSYERRIAREEDKAAPILAKVCRREELAPEEREAFAHFMQLMMKRPSERAQSALPIFQEAADSIPFQRNATRLAELGEFAKALEWLQAEEYLRTAEGGQKRLLNETMLTPYDAVQSALLGRDWTFHVASPTTYFVTSNCPFGFDPSVGLSRFPFWFPVSSEIVLVGGPTDSGRRGYVTASADEVFVVNYLTIHQAERVYSPGTEQWVLDTLEHRVGLTHEQGQAFVRLFPPNQNPSQ